MKTKIYGTIGPACADTDTLVRLFEKGMTGIRINLSHTTLEEASDWLSNIAAAARSGKPEILMDLRGPELRLGKLRPERRILENDMLALVPEGKNNLFDPTEIPVNEEILPLLVSGQEVLLDDGKLKLVVEEKNAGEAECRVLRGGILKSGKSLALPGIKTNLPTLAKSDLANLSVAKSYGITGVMLPFVRGKEDLLHLRCAMKEAGAEKLRVFAKIENLEGVKMLPELLPYCDEVVIARGDLGNAVPLWKLPVLQAWIEEQCRRERKPFMVVTQMLASMEHAKVPTRAEVSDIFRAVSEGADSVMLTGETAVGEYPVEAMDYLVNTVREAERYVERTPTRWQA